MKFPRRISLRSLLIVTALVGVCLAYFLHIHRIKNKERAAIHALQARHHGVGVQKADGFWVGPMKWVLPADFFDHSRSLQVWNFTAEDLSHAKYLPHLRAVHIREDEAFYTTELEEHHFDVFAKHRLLRDVYIDAQFDDRILSHFKASQAERLVLHRTAVTGSGLKNVAPDRLKVLTLYDSPLGDDGLQHVDRFRELRHLLIEHTNSGDRGMPHLSELASLETLCLINLPITDAAIDSLPHENLTRLYLKDVPITNNAIDSLARFAALQDIYFIDTQVTPAGIAQIKEALPGCRYRLEPARGVPRTASGFKYDAVFFAHPGTTGSFNGWGHSPAL